MVHDLRSLLLFQPCVVIDQVERHPGQVVYGHKAGGRPGQGSGIRKHLKEPGVTHLLRPRRGGLKAQLDLERERNAGLEEVCLKERDARDWMRRVTFTLGLAAPELLGMMVVGVVAI